MQHQPFARLINRQRNRTDRPFITTKIASQELKISGQAATVLLSKFEKVGIVAEVTGKQRYKEYIFVEFMRIIQDGTQIK